MVGGLALFVHAVVELGFCSWRAAVMGAGSWIIGRLNSMSLKNSKVKYRLAARHQTQTVNGPRTTTILYYTIPYYTILYYTILYDNIT